MRSALALYGPPASGKDTVTSVLCALDSRYVAFRRLKIGSGRSASYRVTTADEFARLEQAGGIVYRNSRYGNVYGIDRAGLAEVIDADRIPIVHLGQIAAIEAVETFPADWTRALLWCPREVAACRSAARHDADAPSRLAAWDETREELDRNPNFRFDASLRTDQVTPAEAAQAIHAIMMAATG